jgi:hypothetical protein
MPRFTGARVRTGRNYRNRRFRRRRTTTRVPLRRRVARLTRQVRNFPRPELKHVDTFGTQLTLLNNYTPAGCIFPCRNITVGDSDFAERIGDKIRLKSYTLNFNLTLLNGVAWDTVRITVLQFKHNPDAATTPTSFVNMYYNSTTDNSAYNPLALIDWDNNGSFRRLFDRSYNIQAQVAVGSTPAALSQGHTHRIKIKFPKVAEQVQYFGSGSAPSRNELFVLITSGSDTSTVMNFTDRLVYYDN